VEVEYPVGHRRRRAEGMPLLVKKARENLLTRFPAAQVAGILQLCQDAERLEKLKVAEFVEYFLPEH
jgi:2-methylcitrate dehydratase PrpD